MEPFIHDKIKAAGRRISARMHKARGRDLPSLSKELKSVSKALERAGCDLPAALARLESIEARLAASVREKEQRKKSLPKLSYPAALPISARRADIVDAIRSNQVVIITGETGSGKTTQIPKMCIEAGRGIEGAIGCTQPRRIAAISVASRIAEEMDEPLGRSVGYKIRFDERSGKDPWLKIMTDGIFLMELHSDPQLRRYDTIIVDEAHERSLNIDFSLGILRSLLPRRRDLKLIITSATLDSEKFSRAFGDAPIIEVSGRLFPVEVRWEPLEPEQEDSYIEAAVKAVDELCRESAGGDILVFMPTEQDINETCEMLEGRKEKYTVLPLYSRLAWADQRRIFSGANGRKIVVATNIAETSITIPGIKYVIDTGLARISRYNPRSRSTSLPVAEISRSSADQRKGRCGRVRNGVCVRLYSEEDYAGRPLFTSPEILRSNLAEVILKMLALDLGDIPSFPFVDPPSPGGIRDGLALLQELGAVRPKNDKVENPEFLLGDKGRKMSRLPIDPRLSRVLIEAEKQGCIEEAAVICASLATQDPREWSQDKENEARQAHARLNNPSSDFIGILDLWKLYHAKAQELKSRGQLKKFCRDNFLSFRRIKEWIDVYNQLISILSDEGFRGKDSKPLPPAPRLILDDPGKDFKAFYERLHKSVLSGFLSNIAVKKEKNMYTAAKGKEIMLFPGSGLFSRGGNWIVCAEAIETSRMFARSAANIESEWIEEVGGHLCRYSYSEARWDRRRGEVVADEKVTLYGLTIAAGRRVSYGRINPSEAAQIFVRSALVEGDVEGTFPFLEDNRTLIEKFAEMEDKLRRRDIVAGEEALAAFYAERLPGVFDIRTLRKIIREQGNAFLQMTGADAARYMPDAAELAQFPDSVKTGGGLISLSYAFRPGDAADGVTVRIPLRQIHSVNPGDSDRFVPGLIREKITALLKGLPKEYRKKLVPLPNTVDAVAAEIEKAQGPLLPALANCLARKFGVSVPAAAWPVESLPEHLRMRFAITDSQGREIAAGRDLQAVRNSVTAESRSRALENARAKWERSGITKWDFGDIPESIEIEGPGGGAAFPALEKNADSVDLKLFTNADEARQIHGEGVARLLSLHFSRELRQAFRAFFPKEQRSRNRPGQLKLENAVELRLQRILFRKHVRTEKEFLELASAAGPRIYPTLQNIVREVNPVLQAGRELLAGFRDLGKSNAASKPAGDFLAALRADFDSLLSEEFIVNYEPSMLEHVPRHLKALQMRAERGLHHLDKDRLKAQKLVKYAGRLLAFEKEISFSTSAEKRQAIGDFAWMIEEYKVSLFAPELKTAFPVSPKRLDEKIAEIEMMV
jgi:ATP-dependent helicase HrpA